jgi:hypothetical protein
MTAIISRGAVCRADVSSRSPDRPSLHMSWLRSNMKTKMKDDLEVIPMAYLGYVVLAIMTIVAAAVGVVIRLF